MTSLPEKNWRKDGLMSITCRRQRCTADVRFGSLATLSRCLRNVCYASDSDQIAALRHRRFGPETDMRPILPSLSSPPATILLPNSAVRHGKAANMMTTEGPKAHIFRDDLTTRGTRRHGPNRTPKPGVGGSSPSTPATRRDFNSFEISIGATGQRPTAGAAHAGAR
jgi:hypothetical protein